MPAELRKFYEAEARELIDRLTRGAALLAGDPDAERATLADLQRAAHTLKGAAHVVAERKMAALAHDFEDALVQYRAAATRESAAGLLHLADGMAAELEGPTPQPTPADRAATPGTTAPPAGQPPAVQSTPTPPSPRPPANEAPATAKLDSARLRQTSALRSGTSTLRVEAAEAAHLLDQVGATGTLLQRMRGTLDRLDNTEALDDSESRRLRRGDLRRTLRDDLSRLERSLREMSGTAQHLQLGEAESLLLEAGRIVRSTAAAEGKLAETLVSGGAERIDARTLEALGEALIHLLRNAVAHGIELPAQRVAAGKPPAGTVQVAIERRGPDLVLTCADDGRGIPLEQVRDAAVRRGLLSSAAADSASHDELLALLLRPGFSLRESVDAVAGRGVGLDAVSEAVTSVGGTVTIRTLAGQGTTFTLSVPTSLAALQVLELSAAGARYLLPAAAVEHTLRMEPHHTGHVQEASQLRIGAEMMPLVWLHEIVSPPGGAGRFVPASAQSGSTRPVHTAMILRHGERRFALAVDRVEGMTDVVVRTVSTLAGAAAVLSGAALGADGVPVLVLDPMGLADAAHGLASVSLPEATPSVSLPVLVIDDSLTTRMLEQSILEAEGYEVDLAVSAEQGLDKARSRRYGLYLCDVEMPGMNGFDFVRITRADPELRKTPVMLVTSLNSPEHRERGRSAGAAGYIVKGEFNQQIYLDRIRQILHAGAEAASTIATERLQ